MTHLAAGALLLNGVVYTVLVGRAIDYGLHWSAAAYLGAVGFVNVFLGVVLWHRRTS